MPTLKMDLKYREIVKLKKVEGEGYLLELECGHKVTYGGWPTVASVICTECESRDSGVKVADEGISG
jgi:hypothetical protein